MLKYVTPLTIVPTVSLVGLSLFENAADAASKHWGISAGYVHPIIRTLMFMANQEFVLQNNYHVDIVLASFS